MKVFCVWLCVEVGPIYRMHVVTSAFVGGQHRRRRLLRHAGEHGRAERKIPFTKTNDLLHFWLFFSLLQHLTTYECFDGRLCCPLGFDRWTVRWHGTCRRSRVTRAGARNDRLCCPLGFDRLAVRSMTPLSGIGCGSGGSLPCFPALDVWWCLASPSVATVGAGQSTFFDCTAVRLSDVCRVQKKSVCVLISHG